MHNCGDAVGLFLAAGRRRSHLRRPCEMRNRPMRHSNTKSITFVAALPSPSLDQIQSTGFVFNLLLFSSAIRAERLIDEIETEWAELSLRFALHFHFLFVAQ